MITLVSARLITSLNSRASSNAPGRRADSILDRAKLIIPSSHPRPTVGHWKRNTSRSVSRRGSPHARTRPLRQKSDVPHTSLRNPYRNAGSTKIFCHVTHTLPTMLHIGLFILDSLTSYPTLFTAGNVTPSNAGATSTTRSGQRRNVGSLAHRRTVSNAARAPIEWPNMATDLVVAFSPTSTLSSKSSSFLAAAAGLGASPLP